MYLNKNAGGLKWIKRNRNGLNGIENGLPWIEREWNVIKRNERDGKGFKGVKRDLKEL